MLQAGIVGVLRQVQALKRKWPDKNGCKPEDGFKVHINGALGELAFSKLMNLCWSGSEGVKAPDVGAWHVRTRSEGWHDLIIRDDDPDDGAFVLLTGINGSYTVHGWIRAQDAKQPEYRKDPDGRGEAWFVPQDRLFRLTFGWNSA